MAVFSGETKIRKKFVVLQTHFAVQAGKNQSPGPRGWQNTDPCTKNKELEL